MDKFAKFWSVFLQFLYFILAVVYAYTVILLTSIILNTYYTIYLFFKDKYSKVSSLYKEDLNNISDVDDCLLFMRKGIGQYYYDPLNGVVNWGANSKVTYMRTVLLPKEKHSKDCLDHAILLKKAFSKILFKSVGHWGYIKKYVKVQPVSLLSIKPFIKSNHVVLLAHWIDKDDKEYIDIFAPYSYLITIDADGRDTIPEKVEQYYSNNRVKYNKFYFPIFFGK